MVMKHFKKLSDWIDINYVDKDVECSEYMRPVFEYQGEMYHVCDFTKIHNNPWFGSDEGFPEFITGVQRRSTGKPLFIEISPDGDKVRVYEESEVKDLGGNDV